jgi:hypothetical protein
MRKPQLLEWRRLLLCFCARKQERYFRTNSFVEFYIVLTCHYIVTISDCIAAVFPIQPHVTVNNDLISDLELGLNSHDVKEQNGIVL